MLSSSNRVTSLFLQTHGCVSAFAGAKMHAFACITHAWTGESSMHKVRAEYGCKESKDCGGSAFCEHGCQKSRCKDCRGASICEHGRIKYGTTVACFPLQSPVLTKSSKKTIQGDEVSTFLPVGHSVHLKIRRCLAPDISKQTDAVLHTQ
jgi:hypothetical protein